MSEPFIGLVVMFAGNFAPRSWAFCQGQLLSIAQNTALFSILGTTYGGNGQTTFALPDLRGRVPVGPGQGPGLPPVTLGEMAGEPSHTLIITEMPAHNHVLNGSDGEVAGGLSPAGGVDAKGGFYNNTADVVMNPAAIGASGGSQPHNNMQPYLGLNFIIALEGIFPSRN